LRSLPSSKNNPRDFCQTAKIPAPNGTGTPRSP
jgi:hypothetical protein